MLLSGMILHGNVARRRIFRPQKTVFPNGKTKNKKGGFRQK